MKATPSLLWLRLNLRLADNPALHAALKRGGAVLPVYIHAPGEEAPWEPGGASRWWLHQSLRALEAALREKGSRLVIRAGPSLAALKDLAAETRAGAVFWNRRYEPAVIGRDAEVEKGLHAIGLKTANFNGALLFEPGGVRNKSGGPFRVFTPFWKHCLAQPAPAAPLRAPQTLPEPRKWPGSLPLDALELEPKIDWAEGIRAAWQPGVAGAASQLRRFLRDSVSDYKENRNRPDLTGTSRLSPHLHFGEITPRQVWHAVRTRAKTKGIPEKTWRGWQFLTELGWREFAHHLLFHFPQTDHEPLREEFRNFPWRKNRPLLRAWQKGRTGYPIVDAGMRQLWATGWLHNRVRMIAASFLVKDLLLSWQEGSRWFWDTLVDADLAQNTLGWQWTAGCGADAAPYFRIFNPVIQGEKFDPRGDYVRRWCPELAKLPAKWLHKPWEMPAPERPAAETAREYPGPVVRHSAARAAALEAFASIKARGKPGK